jgi:hypothetical protein
MRGGAIVIALVQDEQLSVVQDEPIPMRRSARVAGIFPCCMFLSLISWSSVFVALVVEQDPVEALSALR